MGWVRLLQNHSRSPPSLLLRCERTFNWLAGSKLGRAIPFERPAFAGATARQSSLSTTFRAKTGAGGETRTHTTFYGPRILSPVRLPFRHTGGYRGNANHEMPRMKVRSSRNNWNGILKSNGVSNMPKNSDKHILLLLVVVQNMLL